MSLSEMIPESVFNFSVSLNENESLSDSVLNVTMKQPEPSLLLYVLTKVFVPIVFGLIVVVGLVGNSLVIAVVSTNHAMRNTTNLLILNLAVADLLFITVCVPFTAMDYVLTTWHFGLIWCRTVQYMIYVTAYISIYTLVLMSADRFLAVVFPVSSLSLRTMYNATLACLTTWILIPAAGLPIWFSHSLAYNETYCKFDEDNFSFGSFHIGFFITSFAIPLVLITFMYIFMLKRLWTGVKGHVSRDGYRGKRRVTKLVLVVILVFIVCWAPIQVVLLLKGVNLYVINSEADLLKIVFLILAQVLAYTNSCVNPILYAMMSENFRKAFFKLIPCHFPGWSPHQTLQYEMTTAPTSHFRQTQEIVNCESSISTYSERTGKKCKKRKFSRTSSSVKLTRCRLANRRYKLGMGAWGNSDGTGDPPETCGLPNGPGNPHLLVPNHGQIDDDDLSIGLVPGQDNDDEMVEAERVYMQRGEGNRNEMKFINKNKEEDEEEEEDGEEEEHISLITSLSLEIDKRTAVSFNMARERVMFEDRRRNTFNSLIL